ncbi:hypothetical protein D3C73_687880 [compost metagenome]
MARISMDAPETPKSQIRTRAWNHALRHFSASKLRSAQIRTSGIPIQSIAPYRRLI